MKKKFLVFILAVLIAFSQVACAKKEGDNAPKEESTTQKISTPLFWQVTGNGFDGDFYLLGSIHIGDENTNIYPTEITDAFDECEYLAVESDIIAVEDDFSLQYEMAKAIMYTDGSMIYDHIDSDLYDSAREILKENGMYSQGFDMIMPIYWMMTIENVYSTKTEYSAEYGVDRHFLSEAKDEDKTILEIEDAVETYEALAALAPETQEFLLRQVTASDYKAASLLSTKMLYSIWKNGNEKSFERFFVNSATEMSDQELEMYNEYNDMLLTTRNDEMVDVAVSYMESDKDVFYIVGLAHMLGEDGIVEQLTEMGYTVTQIEYDSIY